MIQPLSCQHGDSRALGLVPGATRFPPSRSPPPPILLVEVAFCGPVWLPGLLSAPRRSRLSLGPASPCPPLQSSHLLGLLHSGPCLALLHPLPRDTAASLGATRRPFPPWGRLWPRRLQVPESSTGSRVAGEWWELPFTRATVPRMGRGCKVRLPVSPCPPAPSLLLLVALGGALCPWGPPWLLPRRASPEGLPRAGSGRLQVGPLFCGRCFCRQLLLRLPRGGPQFILGASHGSGVALPSPERRLWGGGGRSSA